MVRLVLSDRCHTAEHSRLTIRTALRVAVFFIIRSKSRTLGSLSLLAMFGKEVVRLGPYCIRRINHELFSTGGSPVDRTGIQMSGDAINQV